MSLTLEQVFDRVRKQEDPTLGYVYDAPIHYIVLNNNQNTITMPWTKKFIEIIDKVEATTGPGCVVTIGTGKHFSTGFDIHAWVNDPYTYFPSLDYLMVLLVRILTLQVPSMAVFNGNAMAGGYFLGVCHDFRTMNAKRGKVQLTELLFDGWLCLPLFETVKAKMSAETTLKLQMALPMRSAEALEAKAIDATYSDVEDL